MNIAKSILASITIIAFVFCPANLYAQDKPVRGDWSYIERLQPGEEIEVRLKDRGQVRGRFNGLSTNTLIVQKGNSLVETERANIRRIYRVEGKQVGRSTLLGLGIGAATGAVIGGIVAATDGPSESGEEHLPILIFGAGGAIIGTATGVVTGLFRKKRTVIYESM